LTVKSLCKSVRCFEGISGHYWISGNKVMQPCSMMPVVGRKPLTSLGCLLPSSPYLAPRGLRVGHIGLQRCPLLGICNWKGRSGHEGGFRPHLCRAQGKTEQSAVEDEGIFVTSPRESKLFTLMSTVLLVSKFLMCVVHLSSWHSQICIRIGIHDHNDA